MNLLYIRKRSLPEWAALLLLILPFTYSFLTEFIGLPSFCKFISDFLIIASIIVIISRNISNGQLAVPRRFSATSLVITIFFLHTIIGYILNYQTFLYYIWGARNNFRFYLAFLLFVSFIKQNDAKQCLKIMDSLFWVHAVISVTQYVAFGYEQDYLGGIFGVQKGCNGYALVFISIIVLKSLLSYMNGDEKFILCFFKCSVALLLSVLSELKFFFLLFIFILMLSAIVTRFSVKKVALILLSSVLLVIMYTILVELFDYVDGFLSIENLLNELVRENYASSEDIGRFTSIPIISERFLTTIPDKLFGVGLGNCDTSTISIFNTEFYDTYVNIHYSVFSVSFILLETGFIGLALFVSFFAVCLVKSTRALKQKTGDLLCNQMGLIMSILCFVLMFYNSSLRTEAGYMVYFVLALPFIGMNKGVYVRQGG